jgi:hypothetical protein
LFPPHRFDRDRVLPVHQRDGVGNAHRVEVRRVGQSLFRQQVGAVVHERDYLTTEDTENTVGRRGVNHEDTKARSDFHCSRSIKNSNSNGSGKAEPLNLILKASILHGRNASVNHFAPSVFVSSWFKSLQFMASV